MLKLSIFLSIIFVLGSLYYWKTIPSKNAENFISPFPSETVNINSPVPQSNSPETITPKSKILTNDYHIFQSFNNCGPAALSMALSYYGINKSQEELGQSLRPYQNPQGDNDDKSVTLEEVGIKAEEFGLIAYHRPNGSVEILKQFIAKGIPVLARTYLKKDDDIGHYRIIKGYDDTTSQLIQDDSFQGKNLRYSYTEFNELWEDFNFEYLVMVPPDKKVVAESIIGSDIDQTSAWKKSVVVLNNKLKLNPEDTTTLFNLSVAKFNAGDFEGSVKSFERVENKLTFRTLWYQIEPIEAYYETGRYDKVLSLTSKILNNQNRAFSELYMLRAKVYLKQNNRQQASEEIAKAMLYNKNMKIDNELLNQL